MRRCAAEVCPVEIYLMEITACSNRMFLSPSPPSVYSFLFVGHSKGYISLSQEKRYR